METRVKFQARNRWLVLTTMARQRCFRRTKFPLLLRRNPLRARDPAGKLPKLNTPQATGVLARQWRLPPQNLRRRSDLKGHHGQRVKRTTASRLAYADKCGL